MCQQMSGVIPRNVRYILYIKLSGIEMSYYMTYSSYGWNNTGSLVALEPMIAKTPQISCREPMQWPFGELAHYGFEPFL